MLSPVFSSAKLAGVETVLGVKELPMHVLWLVLMVPATLAEDLVQAIFTILYKYKLFL